MDSIALFAANATLVYFGEEQKDQDCQAQKLFQLAKVEVLEWVRLELLDACRNPGVTSLEATIRMPACDKALLVSVDAGRDYDVFGNPMETQEANLFMPAVRPRGFGGSHFSDGNYMTPFGKMPYFLYSKIMTEETPLSRLYGFLSSEYKKLTDRAKVNILSEKDIERVGAQDILCLYRFGGILQAFEAMREANAA